MLKSSLGSRLRGMTCQSALLPPQQHILTTLLAPKNACGVAAAGSTAEGSPERASLAGASELQPVANLTIHSLKIHNLKSSCGIINNVSFMQEPGEVFE